MKRLKKTQKKNYKPYDEPDIDEHGMVGTGISIYLQ